LRPVTPAATTTGGCALGGPISGPESFIGPRWNGWSPGLTNTRFQTSDDAMVTAEEVPKLKLKWAFGFPNATSARSAPTIAGNRVFIGSQSGTVYALSSRLGCIYWTFQAAASVRSAIILGPRPGGGTNAYFGDGRSNVYALDAATGRQLWTRKIDDHPSSHVTGAPVVYQDRLYVPVASGEEGQGGNGKYECCTFRGSIVALNISTGNVLWKTYTIPNEPRTIGRNESGTPRWGTSGAGIWSSPTIDVKRRVI